MEFSLQQRVSIPEDVMIREIDGESVLLNLQTERYFGLDPVGTRMVQVLSDAASIQAALDRLLSEYEVDPERLEGDLRDLIEKLADHGLVEISNE